MKRIATLVAIILALVGWAAIAQAQQAKKVPQIGYLAAGDAATEAGLWLRRSNGSWNFFYAV